MTDTPRGPIYLGDEDPLYRTWVMLLNGYGFNWYRADNQLRADDLLIRSRASEQLGAAAAALREVESGYRRKFMPPPSREHPEPDPQHLAQSRGLREAAERIAALDTRLRGATVPNDDKIWARHRARQEDLLLQLCQCDVVLVGAANEIATLAAGLDAEHGLTPEAEQAIERRRADLAQALDRRNTLLALPIGGP